jgi:hypothetical protein
MVILPLRNSSAITGTGEMTVSSRLKPAAGELVNTAALYSRSGAVGKPAGLEQRSANGKTYAPHLYTPHPGKYGRG